MRKHAETTQQIYEDVSRTLREEEKRRRSTVKRELEEVYEEKARQIENHYNGLLAKER